MLAESSSDSTDTRDMPAPPGALEAAPAVAETMLSSEPEPLAQRKGSFLAPLRVGNFRLLLAGQTVSRIGDQFYFIAIPWLVLRVTNDPLALALVIGSSASAMGLFTLVGGVLADRFGPRALMLGSDVARLLIISVLAALAFLTTPPLWSLAVLSGLLGIGGGLFYPASFAMTPFLVRRDDLQAANSFEQLTNQVSNFAGPGLAGVVLGAAQLALGFVIDAASFIVSVLSLLFIRVKRHGVAGATEEKAQAAEGRGGLGGLGEAVRYLRRTPFLATMFSLSIIANFGVTGMLEVAIPLLLKQLVGVEKGPQALGILVSVFGLGSILGIVAAGLANKVRHKAIVGVFLFMPIAGLMAWMPFVGSVYGLAGIFGVAGVLLGASNVLFITVMQRFIPMELMGRMMAFMLLGSSVGGPLSIFAYGAAATVVPQISWLFIGGGAIIAVVGVFALTKRVIWRTE